MKHHIQNSRQLFGYAGTLAILLFVLADLGLAQTTAFTYQGKLADNGAAANGNYDLTFKLFDTATVGSGIQQGTTLNLTNVVVSGGVFTVQLDFGACASCFNGAARFLEISVKPTSGSSFTTLSPRQAITANPYAIKSLSAATADGLSLTCVSCVTSNQIQSVNGSAVSGTIPLASLPAGSSSYIQNTTSQQAASNFNISGDGTVGGTLSGSIVSAATQYNLFGLRMLSVSGPFSFDTNYAASNTFLGENTGMNTTPDPALNGRDGKFNSFFGSAAGQANTTGNNNSFFGLKAGSATTTGFNNSFFGASAGARNTVDVANTFIGAFADFNTTSIAGFANTLLGFSTRVNADLDYATAIGAFATVTQSDTLVLGAIAGVNTAVRNTKIGIGITAPTYRLHVEEPGNLGFRVGTSSAGGRVASFGPFGNFEIDAPNIPGGRFLVTENGNIGIGIAAPADKLAVAGSISFSTLGAAGSGTLCRNSSFQISACSSSRRYKTNILDWQSGLNLLKRLRPVSFDWKDSQMHDLGLVAEEVAEIEPLLVTHNDKGEIEGVKYDRLGVVLINAIKEQQAQIESLTKQQTQIDELQKENLDLKARLAALERAISHQSETVGKESRNEKKEP